MGWEAGTGWFLLEYQLIGKTRHIFFFFKKRTEKGTESLPNRNSITERTRSRALAGWLNALVLVGSVQASRG